MCLSPIPAVAAALSERGNPDKPPVTSERDPVTCESGASRVADVARARLTEPVSSGTRTCCIA
ncbi:hypothetical protein SAMN04487818_115192 [Actinokineospora terrae]|uniref:Uncharacterized protein n=1 Tax=Actinokineospora terrae TaxID=155974 RepID=A0A1H9XIL9_9PSEU|nr:hypothetical protein SAMN04487818_115192 [Actinokineospora terrae]